MTIDRHKEAECIMELKMLKCYLYEIFIAILQFQRADDWGGKQTRLDRMPVCGTATGCEPPP